MLDPWKSLNTRIANCQLCPRLREHCIAIASTKRKSFEGETYWGKPLPNFGVAPAGLLVVGLAPAAHGGNRTGRIFTGDRSGDWLFGALYRAGYANQPTSVRRDDGLRLIGAYIGACVRCAPPANKPTPAERDACLPYLQRELGLLTRVRVIVCLGKFAYDGVAQVTGPRPRPPF